MERDSNENAAADTTTTTTGGGGANVLSFERALSGPAALEPPLTSAERRAFRELLDWMRTTRERFQLVHAKCPVASQILGDIR
jgi:hypothetical protein